MLWKMIRVDPKERSSAEELLKEAWLQDDENEELVNTLQPNEGAIKQPSHMSASPARWSTPFQSDLPTPPPSSAANPLMELDMGNELVHSSIPPRSSGCNLVEPAVGLQTNPPLSPEKISQNDQKIEEGQNFLRRIQEPEKKLDQRRHEQELRLLTKQNDTILGELGQEKQKFQDLEQGLKALDAIFVKKNKKKLESVATASTKQMQRLKQHTLQLQAGQSYQAEIKLLKHEVELQMGLLTQKVGYIESKLDQVIEEQSKAQDIIMNIEIMRANMIEPVPSPSKAETGLPGANAEMAKVEDSTMDLSLVLLVTALLVACPKETFLVAAISAAVCGLLKVVREI
ncbi:hypothetical protein BLS_001040 [Venturia inaequalis]|nr:hypothetical protein BLS_001040 [Venturia inaequalis]